MNGWRGVYLFVEGQDDVLFVERILKPRLEIHFEFVATIAYASIRQATLAQQARAIQKSGAQLWVIADYDNAPCFTARRTEVVQRFDEAIEMQQVLLARPEIEAWYCAGISEPARFRVQLPSDIESITKERFNRLFARLLSRQIRTELLLLLLDNYDWEVALRRSASLHYCARKLGILSGEFA